MKILFTTLPGYGHVLPLVPLAMELKDKGHNISFAIAKSFTKKINDIGFDCISVGFDWDESQLEQILPSIKEVPPIEQNSMIRKLLWYDAPVSAISDSLSFFKKEKPDVIISSGYDYSGQILAEILDVPCVVHSIDIRMPSALKERIHGDYPKMLREKFGLSTGQALNKKNLELSFMPKCWELPGYESPSNEYYIRPQFFDNIKGEQYPDWISHYKKKPIVYVSLGTVFNDYPAIFQSIIEGLKNEPINLIVTIGPNGDTSVFGKQPDNVCIKNYIPQSFILPHTSVSINHGGVSTIMAALSNGIPLINLPLSGDQTINSNWCQMQGVAVDLGNENFNFISNQRWDIQVDQITPELIKKSIIEALDNTKYKSNAIKIKEEINCLPDLSYAVNLIEQSTRQ